jgi:cytochrome b6-f complex iron-sulfur subunit
MDDKNKISRRKMLKKFALSFTIPTSILWFFGAKKKVATSSKKRIVIPDGLPEGITFLENAIVKKNGYTVTVFSSKCTHLGCKINGTINDKLVCPCHGSKFNFNGVPENGPATVPLKQLEIVKDKSTGELVVYV